MRSALVVTSFPPVAVPIPVLVSRDPLVVGARRRGRRRLAGGRRRRRRRRLDDLGLHRSRRRRRRRRLGADVAACEGQHDGEQKRRYQESAFHEIDSFIRLESNEDMVGDAGPTIP
jgi:hypothetical protein